MRNREFIVSVVIFLLTMVGVFVLSRREDPVVVATNLEKLPMEILGFKATEDFFPQSVYDELNADFHLYRHYISPEGKKIDLYIGYYGTAKGGRTPHNPYACLPGAGWGLQRTEETILRSRIHPEGIKVNYIQARKGESFSIVLHWYQSDRDKVLATGIQQNIQRFIGRVLHNRNDGAFVRISAITTESGIEEAEITTRTFAEAILALLPEYWPEER